MNAAQVLVQVLLARESLSSVALAVMVWAVQLFAWATVLVMHFALMAKQPATVCETWKFLATLGRAFIWAVVLIHMLSVGRFVSYRYFKAGCRNNG